MTENNDGKKSEIEELFEEEKWDDIIDHDQTEIKFKLVAGYCRNMLMIDTRRYICLFDTAAGYFYYVVDAIYRRVELMDDIPDPDLFVEDAYDYIKYATNENDYDLDESYEAINHGTDVYNDLRKKVESEIQDEFEE